MAFASQQRFVYGIGHVEKWIQRMDLGNRRIRLVDLRGHVVGRAAAAISQVLQGKDRPDYTPEQDGGDVVVAINADAAVLTGKKMEEKIYYSHSGKPGCLKERTPAEVKAKHGAAAIVWRAVNGMLPKNKLRKHRLQRLLIYDDSRHDFDTTYMFPLDLPDKKHRINNERWQLPEGFTPMNPVAYFSLWRGSDPEWQEKCDEWLQQQAADTEGAPSLEPTPETRALAQGVRIQ